MGEVGSTSASSEEIEQRRVIFYFSKKESSFSASSSLAMRSEMEGLWKRATTFLRAWLVIKWSICM